MDSEDAQFKLVYASLRQYASVHTSPHEYTQENKEAETKPKRSQPEAKKKPKRSQTRSLRPMRPKGAKEILSTPSTWKAVSSLRLRQAHRFPRSTELVDQATDQHQEERQETWCRHSTRFRKLAIAVRDEKLAALPHTWVAGTSSGTEERCESVAEQRMIQ